MRSAGHIRKGAQARPVREVTELLGYRLLADRSVGPWLREMILQTLRESKWKQLARIFKETSARRAKALHGNMIQGRAGSRVMASYWHQGSHWARSFCEVVGLPEFLGVSRRFSFPADENVLPADPLPPLHSFQQEAYRALRRLLRNGTGRAAMLSLPTGAGKTRVAVEAVCDHLAEGNGAKRNRNLALWVAQSHELQTQAWECFRQVWQVPPRRDGEPIRRIGPLRIVRLWGGRKPENVQFSQEPTIIIAGIDQLASWVRNQPEFLDQFPRRRLACVILDEAHFLITREFREVLVALRLRAKREWKTFRDSALVVGLTSTPWRSDDAENASLRRYFQQDLLRPESLGKTPIRWLQRAHILANVRTRPLRVRETPKMTPSQRRRYERFNDLPTDYLRDLGLDAKRNAQIVEQLLRLPKKSRVLVFGCSIEHAETLAIALNRARGNDVAAVVTGETPRAERADVIERFRRGKGLRILCNVGVLTTGFDAPSVDVVCIARPTTSAIRYEQMVGRGLRGPKNGGTSECLVLDVQDEGLPEDVQSYARVAMLWDSGRQRLGEK
jgi:DNA repair protein RadD